MNDEVKSFRPKLPSGVIDWETMFEDPTDGLIAHISNADSIHALRVNTIAAIKDISTSEEERDHIDAFVANISAMLPDDTPDELLPKMTEAVLVILRQMKVDHIEKAGNIERKVAARRHKLRRQKAKRQRTSIGAVIGTLVAVAGVGTLIWLSFTGIEKEATPVQEFITQMIEASQSKKPAPHIFGGRISVGSAGKRVFVSASNMPPLACASAAWVFANKGTVVINGVMPTRVSPRILKGLCEKEGKFAQFIWFPKVEKPQE